MEPKIANDQTGARHPTAEVDADALLPVVGDHIVRTPGTCSGKPRIEGTRIKVEQVVIWHDQMGMSAAEIVTKWCHLTIADVNAALAYYHEHRDEIDRDLAAGDQLFEELKANQPSILEKIRQRKADVADDQVSPQ
jgi:uncharacterized protein (DUF433 family)